MKLADVLATLPKIAPKSGHKKAIQAVAFSPQAKVIAVGTYAEVQLLDGGDPPAGAHAGWHRGQGERAALFRRWLDALRGSG
ncbi:MAG: hypothetical protein WDN28_04610 [Chthoniobacter sp.]